MANDTKRYGKKYRILVNAVTKAWDVISFWTSARDVELDDGSSAQDTFDALKNDTTALQTTVGGLSTNNEYTVLTAPMFDSSLKYSKGDLVTYNGSIFKCIVDINTPESWVPSHWEAVGEPIPFKFGIDSDGNYGYIKAGADSVTPFKSEVKKILLASGANGGGTVSAEIIRQKCAQYHLNPNKLTSANFIMEMTGFVTRGIYSQMGDKTPDASGTISAPSLIYNNGALSYNTGAWRQGGWNQNVWIHGSRGGYDFYIDIQRPGAGNWTNGYHSDSSGTLNETIQVSFDIAASCNIYLLA